MILERAYRRLLTAFPATWRREHGEEILGCLLDSAEQRGASRPSVPEAVDLVGHGLLVRSGLLGGVVDVRTRELIATLAMASLGALAALCVFFGEWWPWSMPVPNSGDTSLSALPGTRGPFNTAGGRSWWPCWFLCSSPCWAGLRRPAGSSPRWFP